MNLTLRFFATFRDAVGEKTVQREFEEETTVGEVFRSLEAEYGDLEGQLLKDGEIRGNVRALRNGRAVAHMEGPDTELTDGDTLSVFPPVAGGRGPVAAGRRSIAGEPSRRSPAASNDPWTGADPG